VTVANLKADPDREGCPETGIFVRAQDSDGKWGPIDICHLTRESLLEWLRSHGGCNPLAENVVGILFGHGHITEATKG
jgi:hypothetical protein